MKLRIMWLSNFNQDTDKRVGCLGQGENLLINQLSHQILTLLINIINKHALQLMWL